MKPKGHLRDIITTYGFHHLMQAKQSDFLFLYFILSTGYAILSVGYACFYGINELFIMDVMEWPDHKKSRCIFTT